MAAEIASQVKAAVDKMTGQPLPGATTKVNGKMQGRPIYPKNQVVYNFMDHDFTGQWDGRNYTFKAGCVYRVSVDSDDGDDMGRLLLNESIPRHFARKIAKHYIGTKMNMRLAKRDKPQVWSERNHALVAELIDKALTTPIGMPGIELPAPVVEQVTAPKKKMGRSPAKKAEVKETKAEEFEGVTA